MMEETIEDLKLYLKNAEEKIERQKEDLKANEHEIILLENEINELENQQLSDFSMDDIKAEYFSHLGFEQNIVNEAKLDLFLENIEKIPLAQLERFMRHFNSTSATIMLPDQS